MSMAPEIFLLMQMKIIRAFASGQVRKGVGCVALCIEDGETAAFEALCLNLSRRQLDWIHIRAVG